MNVSIPADTTYRKPPVPPPAQTKPMELTREFYAPLPPPATTPFDHLALPQDGHPYAAVAAPVQVHQVPHQPQVRPIEPSAFFSSPLPFDSEMILSMQSVSSLANMHDTMMPGRCSYRSIRLYS